MGELVQGLIGGDQQFVMILGGQLDVSRTQAADRCLCRGQRRAQVVADRCEQRRPHPVGLRDGPGRLGFRDRRSCLPGVAHRTVCQEAYHHRHGDENGHGCCAVQLAAQDGEHRCQQHGQGISG